MSFLTIRNLKNKDKEIKEYLDNRNKIKNDFDNKKIFDNEFKNERDKFFIPLTDSNENVLKEIKKLKQPKELPMIENPKQLLMIENPKPKLLPMIENSTPKASTSSKFAPSIETKIPTPSAKSAKIKVSHIIGVYLSDTNDKSNAGYSLRYYKDKNAFSIGNSYINFVDNEIVVKSKRYIATNGLMELLTKSNPNENKIIEDDYNNYKQILEDTNGIYIKFDPKMGLTVFNKSGKFKIIREKLFPDLFLKKAAPLINLNSESGSGIKTIILSDDVNELINQLRLSLSSFKAGNNGEYNRINSILDVLLRKKIINKKDFKSIRNFIKP